MMTGEGIPVCASADLPEGEQGVRFPLTAAGEDATGFVVRHQGVVHGYLNRCLHLPLELDQGSGRFFDSSGHFLMCAKHGAVYMPDTGRCAGGPCSGGRLQVIHVEEKDGRIVWHPDEFARPVRA
ncbi:MAG: Rieske 2Fe-2S protein [Burkholderiaceae bacterium]|nr:Rieske 2Fe-2S protein [Burkholderiaceae bacterium]